MNGVSRKPKRISLRNAIDAKCKECIYDPYGCAGTWRQQVAACTSRNCPLFPVRPMPAPETVTDAPEKGDFSTKERRSPSALYRPKGAIDTAAKREAFSA